MKGVLLSLAAGLFLFIAATFLFRIYSIVRRARALNIIFLCVFFLLIAAHLLTPADLGFLPESAVAPLSFVDLLFAAFLYSAGYLGGILQIYNLADRGLSLRIIIDISIAPTKALTGRGVLRLYSSGQGIEWMYNKRLDGMFAAGLIQSRGEFLELTQRGRKIAQLFSALQSYFRIRCEVSDS
jgi:hypothetical protein